MKKERRVSRAFKAEAVFGLDTEDREGEPTRPDSGKEE